MVERFHNLKPFALSLVVILVSTLYSSKARALTDEVIRQNIEAKVSDTSALEGTQVRVYVEDGMVVLSGTVRLYEQKMRYEKIAWQTRGVAEVENEIRVIPKFPLDDIAIERKIGEIFKIYPWLHGVQLTVIVKDGAVVLQGIFEHPRNVLFLKHKVAEIEGVISVEIKASFIV